MNNGQRVLVFGASSAICQELLRLYAVQGGSFYLVGRSEHKLVAVGDDLVARGGQLAGHSSYDFNDWEQHQECLVRARESLGEVDLVVVAHGTLPDQEECESSSAAVKTCLDDNFTSAAIIIQVCAQQLSQQGKGTLAVLSSVAGDRGRKSNYTYGAAKAGIDAFLQGLQGRFAGTEINIVNIKPGMIESPMTSGMTKGAVWSTPEKIAPTIYKAIEQGRRVCYVPGYWRLIMLIIRGLPTSVLARLPI
jgi:decaprenylphospho-beta-D-erythro-pentofuranosid-2-ulose 2-reductase